MNPNRPSQNTATIKYPPISAQSMFLIHCFIYLLPQD
nr:MAG TPA: hypothetical protein [Caudoviricetes sp.]